MILQKMIQMDKEALANNRPLPHGIIIMLPGDDDTFVILVVDSG